MSTRLETENYKYWTQSEDEELKRLVSLNTPIKKIAEIMKRSKISCQSRSSKVLKLKNGYIRKTHSHDENFFSTPNEINSYWAGFTAADGCIFIKGQDTNTSTVYALSLEQGDINSLNILKQQCNYSGDIKIYNKNKRECKKERVDNISHMATFKIHSAYQWAKDLENNFNVTSKKTYRLGPPKNLDIKLLICYFIGYIDGDGTIFHSFRPTYKYAQNHISIKFVSASEELIKWVNYFVEVLVPISFTRSNKLNPVNKIRKCKNANAHGTEVSGLRALLLYDFLRSFQVPRMARKWDQPGILSLLEENRLKYPEIFKKYKDYTDGLLKQKQLNESV